MDSRKKFGATKVAWRCLITSAKIKSRDARDRRIRLIPFMWFTPHPNAGLVIASLLTIWLAIFFFLPSPSGPDRAMMGWACILLQTPRWICMALVLGICVARGAFAWPESGAAQYAIVFAVHAALGVGAICASLGGLGMTSGIPDWLARLLQLGAVLVPSIEIAFAAWFLNPWLRKGLDGAALRHVTNSWLVAFGSTVAVFVLAGAAAWILSAADTAKRRGDYEAEQKVKQDAAEQEEDRQFQALKPESPLSDWMAFLEYPHTDEHQRAAREAILKRPNLAEELSAEIASIDSRTSAKAMYFAGQMSPPPADIAESVRKQAHVVMDVAESIDPASSDSRNVLYAKVHRLANAVMAAALALCRTGVDLRPELHAMANACGPREQVAPRDIMAGCEQTIRYFDQIATQRQ
jgi:hypothetical protein